MELQTRAEDASVAVEFSVPFHDCDPLHVVWHGNYLRYLELARTALFQRRQLDVEDMRALEVMMFVSESRCRYLFPLHYNDRVRVRARFTQVEAILRVSFSVENLTHGRKSARAHTELALTDPSGNLLHALPEVVRTRILDV